MRESARPKILIADGHTLVAEAFKNVLECEFEVVQIVSDGIARINFKIILKNPDLSIVAEGHTDTTRSAELHQQLSDRRAAAVRDDLLAQGVPAEKISFLGRVFPIPVADNDTTSG